MSSIQTQEYSTNKTIKVDYIVKKNKELGLQNVIDEKQQVKFIFNLYDLYQKKEFWKPDCFNYLYNMIFTPINQYNKDYYKTLKTDFVKRVNSAYTFINCNKKDEDTLLIKQILFDRVLVKELWNIIEKFYVTDIVYKNEAYKIFPHKLKEMFFEFTKHIKKYHLL